MSVKYPPVWHDPQGALTFLRTNLEARIGATGRPVVLASHCGFDTDWWTPDDWAALGHVVAPYRVVLYLYGHTGTGVRRFCPAGGDREWVCLNTGQTAAGFFVVEITPDRIRAAYRRKDRLRWEKHLDGRISHQWEGGWRWDHLVQVSLQTKSDSALTN